MIPRAPMGPKARRRRHHGPARWTCPGDLVRVVYIEPHPKWTMGQMPGAQTVDAWGVYLGRVRVHRWQRSWWELVLMREGQGQLRLPELHVLAIEEVCRA